MLTSIITGARNVEGDGDITYSPELASGENLTYNLISQEPLRLFNSALQVANSLHLRQIHANRNKGLRNFR